MRWAYLGGQSTLLGISHKIAPDLFTTKSLCIAENKK
jgi:hypothetical protein